MGKKKKRELVTLIDDGADEVKSVDEKSESRFRKFNSGGRIRFADPEGVRRRADEQSAFAAALFQQISESVSIPSDLLRGSNTPNMNPVVGSDEIADDMLLSDMFDGVGIDSFPDMPATFGREYQGRRRNTPNTFTQEYQGRWVSRDMPAVNPDRLPAMNMMNVIYERHRHVRELERNEERRGMPMERFIAEFATFEVNMGRMSGHTTLAIALLEHSEGPNAVMFANRLISEQRRSVEELRRSTSHHFSIHQTSDFDRDGGHPRVAERVPLNMVIIDGYSHLDEIRIRQRDVYSYFNLVTDQTRCPFFVFLG